MAGAPPAEPGQLSPDGTWRWDGARWMPAQPQRGSRRRSRPWFWVLAGCTTVFLLTAGGAAYWIYSFVQGVEHGSNTCLPSDFPKYPRAVYAGFSFDLNGTYPGTTCHITMQSSDDAPTVTEFYQTKLNTGDWLVTPGSDQGDRVTFQPARSDTPFGTVQVAVGDGHTDITIDLYSSTCLSFGFPRYPGARFGGQSMVVEAQRACHVVFVSSNSVAAVTAYYESALNTGSWQLTSSSAGQVGFRLTEGKRTIAHGTVTIAVAGGRTEIRIDEFS